MSFAIGDIVSLRARVVQGPSYDGRLSLHLIDQNGGQHLAHVKSDRVNCRESILVPQEWVYLHDGSVVPDGAMACEQMLAVIQRDLGGGAAVGTWQNDNAVVAAFAAHVERMGAPCPA